MIRSCKVWINEIGPTMKPTTRVVTFTYPLGYYRSQQAWEDFLRVLLNANEIAAVEDTSTEGAS